jgi:hypothetical protein
MRYRYVEKQVNISFAAGFRKNHIFSRQSGSLCPIGSTGRLLANADGGV